MEGLTRPVLDWHPPSGHRKAANQPYRLFAQMQAKDEKELHLQRRGQTRLWKRKLWLDQGKEGACTGFGAAHSLSLGRPSWPAANEDAFRFYYLARQNDEWAGEDYEGSSVLGACEGLKKAGIIHGYWWAETPEEFKAAIAWYGGLDLGTVWKTGMFEPDSNGFVHATGNDEGGHSYCVGGINLPRNLGRIDNSWGKRWGIMGSAYIDLDELFSLVFEQKGEAALLRRNPVNPALLYPNAVG